jgi:DNA-binding transcriptional ArsR family regulator
LENVRNVKSGVEARSKILDVLESMPCSAARIAEIAAVSYSVAMHHLRLLKKEDIVHRYGRRPYCWESTGIGQRRLQG